MVVPGLLGPRGVRVDRAGAASQVVEFAASGDTVSLGRERAQGEVKLRGEDGFGLRLEETLRFHADGYTVEVDLRVENRHSVAQGAEIVIGWDAPVEWPKDRPEQFQGQHPTRIVGSWGGGVQRIEMAQAKAAVEDGQWVGVESEWYLSALVPRSAGFRLYQSATGAGEPGKSPREVGVGLRAALPVLQPGQHQRMGAFRAAISALRAGHALLIFPTSDLDPDPDAQPGSVEAFRNWSPSIEMLLRQAPGTRLQIAIMSGVLVPRFLHHPLARLPQSVKARRSVAELLQMLQQLVLPRSLAVVPRLSCGRLTTFEELTADLGVPGIHQGIITEAETVLAKHMAPPRPAPCPLEGLPL